MKLKRLLFLFLGLTFTVCQAQDIEKQKAKLKLFKEEKLEGSFAALHKKYTGKVVFSNSEIERTDPETKYITTYTLGDKLSVRAFLPQSMMNSMFLQMVENGVKAKDINDANNSVVWHAGYNIHLYLDGKGISTVEDTDSEINTSLSQKATLNDGADKTNDSDLKFGERLYKKLKSKFDLLTPGKHKLKLVYVPFISNSIGNDFTFKPIAEGEIEMIVKNAILDKNDPDVCMPPAKMNDKGLESKILNFVKSKGFKIEPKKVKLAYDKWSIKRNEYGIITKRYIDAYVGYIKDGKCKYIYLDINQDYNGKGYQDEIYYTTGIDLDKDKVISCDCLK